MDTLVWFACAAPIVVLVGVDKGGFAGAFGPLAVPLMSLVMPPMEAAAVLLPVLLVMDAYGVWMYRRAWDGRKLVSLLVGAVLGIAVGWIVAGRVSENAVRLLLGVTTLGLLAIRAAMSLRRRESSRASPITGAACGAVSGFTSFVAHAGGPPFQFYMLQHNLERRVFVGTSVVYFAVLNVLKIVPYAALGLLNTSSLTGALVLLPLGPLGIALGGWIVRRVPDRPFYIIAYALLVLVSCKLIWDGAVSPS